MLHRIGIIYPGGAAAGTEFAMLENWLQSRGLAKIAVTIVYSHSDGLHGLASLKETAALDIIGEAARALKESACSAALWACTSGSFIHGAAGARHQISLISELVDAPATSTSLALARAARWMGGSVEVISPYPAEIGARFIAFLAEFGVTVTKISHLNTPSGQESRCLDLCEEIRCHEARYGRTAAPLLVPDTAIDTLDFVSDLEATFGRVLLTANQASVWDALRLAGFNTPLDSAGVLFKSMPPAGWPC